MPAGPERTLRLDAAVAGAIECPMLVLEIAAEVATLAADLAARGNRNLEGDAITGALLAEAAARSAATLAQLNVSMLSRHAVADAHLERLRPGPRLRHPRPRARGRGRTRTPDKSSVLGRSGRGVGVCMATQMQPPRRDALREEGAGPAPRPPAAPVQRTRGRLRVIGWLIGFGLEYADRRAGS